MKKLLHFKPSLVTKEFFPGYLDVSVINEGECFIWAYYAHLIFADVHLWHTDCHAFVKYHGRFYDSETLKGSPDWQDLPATEHGSWRASPVSSLARFKADWGGSLSRFDISWNKIEHRARKFLRHAT